MKKSSEKTEGERQKEKGLGKLMCVCAHKSSLSEWGEELRTTEVLNWNTSAVNGSFCMSSSKIYFSQETKNIQLPGLDSEADYKKPTACII